VVHVSSEVATYRRIRAAITAARATAETTTLVGSTELNLPTAALYAQDHLLGGGLKGIFVVQRVGKLEIGPERRLGLDRRSGHDRRDDDRRLERWAERRVNPPRRQVADRRVPAGNIWD
jgi:hypothetical protein